MSVNLDKKVRWERKRKIEHKALTALTLLSFTVLAACKTSVGPKGVAAEKQLFNKDWAFHVGSLDSIHAFTDTGSVIIGAEANANASWEKVTLPHDWSIEGAFSKAHPAGNAGGALPGGIGWYRKLFTLSAKDTSRFIEIRFDGIYRNSEVWINGHYLGKRPNGFLGFDYNMSEYLNYDGSPNVLLVRVDNSLQPNSRWYSGSGINRNVYLIKKGSLAINDKESFFYASIPERADKKIATVQLHQHLVLDSLMGKANLAQPIEVKTVIYDKEGAVALEKNGEWQPNATRQQSLDWVWEMRDFKTWSPSDPYLYKWEVSLSQGGILIDRINRPLGIRSTYFDPEKGFYLNGEHTVIKGVCLHSDYGVLGTAYNYSAMARQLTLLKEMGVNAIRTAHNPPPPDMLALTDSMGFLVMDEAFDMWQKKKNKYDYHMDFKDWHKRDLEDQVKRDRNHPSVFMWSVGNEIREQFDSTGTRLVSELVGIVKALDSTRPVTAGLTETYPEKNFITQAGALDVLGFNYKIFDYDSLPIRFPGKALIASETVSALETRGMYKNMPKDSILYMPENSSHKFAENINGDWTLTAYDKAAAYWGTTHENAWRAVKQRPFMTGTFVWTGIDYLGEPVPYPFPARSSYYGVIDHAGLVKDVYYFYQSEWTDKPVLHLLPHWNWTKGEQVAVWAYYSQADSVELFLNGKSLGACSKNDGKPGDSDFHVEWQVSFEPGELKAVSYKDGKQVLTQTVKTAGSPKEIALQADKSFYRGVDGDLIYVSLQLKDEAGNPVPNSDKTLHFTMSGEAELVGVNNGYQADLNSFKSPDYRTWKGKAVAVIRPASQTANFKLSVSGEGLQESVLDMDLTNSKP